MLKYHLRLGINAVNINHRTNTTCFCMSTIVLPKARTAERLDFSGGSFEHVGTGIHDASGNFFEVSGIGKGACFDDDFNESRMLLTFFIVFCITLPIQ